jgi:HEAT repeat protein
MGGPGDTIRSSSGPNSLTPGTEGYPRVEDLRSNEQLFGAAFEGDYDDDAPWNAVRVLRLRGTPEIFELAKGHAESEDGMACARALDVLAQLGAGKPDSERPYLSESISIALQHLEDKRPLVVHSAAWALAHLRGDAATSALIALKRHPDSGVRLAVANGLGGCLQPEALETMIQLMDDDADDVRDWATFGLGSQCSQDSQEIRAALRKRLGDPFEDARDEALWGLAQRKDPSSLRLLLERLQSEQWKAGDEAAAEETLNLQGNTPVEQLRQGLRDLLASINCT